MPCSVCSKDRPEKKKYRFFSTPEGEEESLDFRLHEFSVCASCVKWDWVKGFWLVATFSPVIPIAMKQYRAAILLGILWAIGMTFLLLKSGRRLFVPIKLEFKAREERISELPGWSLQSGPNIFITTGEDRKIQAIVVVQNTGFVAAMAGNDMVQASKEPNSWVMAVMASMERKDRLPYYEFYKRVPFLAVVDSMSGDNRVRLKTADETLKTMLKDRYKRESVRYSPFQAPNVSGAVYAQWWDLWPEKTGETPDWSLLEAAPAAEEQVPSSNLPLLDGIVIQFNKDFSPREQFINSILNKMIAMGSPYRSWMSDSTPLHVLVNPDVDKVMSRTARATVEFSRILGSRFSLEQMQAADFQGSEGITGYIYSHWSGGVSTTAKKET